MRPYHILAIVVLAAPACAGYGPADPRGLPVPVTAPGVVPPLTDSSHLMPSLRSAEAALMARGLIVPVAGIDPTRLRDSYTAARSGARTHNAIDIMAGHGTPVLAADSGRILRMSRSPLGGITVYATDPAGQLVYYYAHLSGYREGLAEGMTVARGDTLGFVGSSGNASADAPHLHFQVMRMPAERRNYWNGEPINPYPALAAGSSRARSVTQAGAEREP